MPMTPRARAAATRTCIRHIDRVSPGPQLTAWTKPGMQLKIPRFEPAARPHDRVSVLPPARPRYVFERAHSPDRTAATPKSSVNLPVDHLPGRRRGGDRQPGGVGTGAGGSLPTRPHHPGDQGCCRCFSDGDPQDAVRRAAAVGHHLRRPPWNWAAQFVRWRPDRESASCTYDQLDRPVRFNLADVLIGGEGPA